MAGTDPDALARFLTDHPSAHVSRGTVTPAQGLLLLLALSVCALYFEPAIAYLFGTVALTAIWINRTERYAAVAEEAVLVKPSALTTEVGVIERAQVARCTVAPTKPWRLLPEPTLTAVLADGRTITLRQLSDGARLAELLAVPHRCEHRPTHSQAARAVPGCSVAHARRYAPTASQR